MEALTGLSGASGVVAVGGGGAAWEPSMVANTMIEWLRADTSVFQDTAETTPIAADALIGRWKDTLSGSGHNLDQTSSPKKPVWKASIVNGHPVARFDGFDDQLTSGVVGSHAQPLSVFAVIGNYSSGFSYISDSRSGSTPGIVLNTGTQVMAAYAGGADVAQATTGLGTAGVFHYCLFEISGASTKFYLDGSDDGSDADGTKPGSAAYDQFDMGGNGTIFSQIDVAERVVWDGVLSAGDKTNLWAYASARYGI